jgi:hypothetical protein
VAHLRRVQFADLTVFRKEKENKDFQYLVQQRTAGPFELAIEISKHNIEVRKKGKFYFRFARGPQNI